MPPYTYITKQHQLDLALSQIQTMDRIAIDTESSGFYTYRSDLCLIQISAGPYHFIIDTLQDLKLQKLGELFSSHGITKIFHAAASDITELKKAYNFSFENIFDTFIACRMLARESCSLAGLANGILGVEMEKGEQKSNWKKRPLTESQLRYAHLDTAYLEKLMDHLKQELSNRGLLEEFYEEVDWTIHLEERESNDSSSSGGQENGWLKISGAQYLPPEARGRLRILTEVRDQIARRHNLALFRVAANKALIEFASKPPSSLAEIRERKLLHPRFADREGIRFLESLEHAVPVFDDELPARKPFDQEVEETFTRLKKWRSSVAEKRNIDPTVILSNKVLKTLASKKPQTLEEIKQMHLMPSGKLQRYGNDLLLVVNGKKNVEQK